MNAELRPLTPADGLDVYDMLQEIPHDECGVVNGADGMSFEEFKRWLVKSDRIAQGVGLEDWQVAQSTYWLYVDGGPVGFGKVRHRLTEKLLQEVGTIGYAVRPSERGRGYGTLLLKLLLEKAWALGADRVLVTIREENLPSLRVALGNGGTVEKTENGRHYVWIAAPVK